MTSAMTSAALTEKLLGIKRENGWSWKHCHISMLMIMTSQFHELHAPFCAPESVGYSK